jgi:hypothetical protein
MPTLPVSPKEVGAIVREKSALYQPQGPRIPGDPATQNKPSNATPENIRGLLAQLDAYTKAVQEAADDEGLTTDANVQQWANDMSNWQYRLGHYYEVLRLVPAEQAGNLLGADAIYFKVTAPLLDGVYYEVLPGIVLSADEKQRIAAGGASNWKPPDVYMPFTLGNQVIEYREHQRERWEKLWEDLKSGMKRLGLPEGWDIWRVLKAVGAAAAGALVGAGLTYGAIKVASARRGPGAMPPGSPPYTAY